MLAEIYIETLLLRAKRIKFTALDASQVDFVRRSGNKVYYGDASRLDLLQAASAEADMASDYDNLEVERGTPHPRNSTDTVTSNEQSIDNSPRTRSSI